MSEPIKAGDLVMQVKSCCQYGVGRIFIVGSVLHRGFRCRCGFEVFEVTHAFTENVAGAPLEWLKRIPPLEELEGEKREEKLLEPV